MDINQKLKESCEKTPLNQMRCLIKDDDLEEIKVSVEDIDDVSYDKFFKPYNRLQPEQLYEVLTILTENNNFVYIPQHLLSFDTCIKAFQPIDFIKEIIKIIECKKSFYFTDENWITNGWFAIRQYGIRDTILSEVKKRLFIKYNRHYAEKMILHYTNCNLSLSVKTIFPDKNIEIVKCHYDGYVGIKDMDGNIQHNIMFNDNAFKRLYNANAISYIDNRYSIHGESKWQLMSGVLTHDFDGEYVAFLSPYSVGNHFLGR